MLDKDKLIALQEEYIKASKIPDGLDVIDLEQAEENLKNEKANLEWLQQHDKQAFKKADKSKLKKSVSHFLKATKEATDSGSKYGLHVNGIDSIFTFTKKGLKSLRNALAAHKKIANSKAQTAATKASEMDKIDEWAADAENKIDVTYTGPARIMMDFGVAAKAVYNKLKTAFADPDKIKPVKLENAAEAENEPNKGDAEAEAKNKTKLSHIQQQRLDSQKAKESLIKDKDDKQNKKGNTPSKPQAKETSQPETKHVSGDMLDLANNKDGKLFLSNEENRYLDSNIYPLERKTGIKLSHVNDPASKETIFSISMLGGFKADTAVDNNQLSDWIKEDKNHKMSLKTRLTQLALNTADSEMNSIYSKASGASKTIDSRARFNDKVNSLSQQSGINYIDGINQYRQRTLLSKHNKIQYLQKLPLTAVFYSFVGSDKKIHDIDKAAIDKHLDKLTREVGKTSKIPMKDHEAGVKDALTRELFKSYEMSGRMDLNAQTGAILKQGQPEYKSGEIVMRALGVDQKNKLRMKELLKHNRHDPALADKLAYVGIDQKTGLPYKMRVKDINQEITSIMQASKLRGVLDAGELHETNSKLFSEAAAHVIDGDGLDSGTDYLRQKYLTSEHGRSDLVKQAQQAEKAGKISKPKEAKKEPEMPDMGKTKQKQAAPDLPSM